MKNLIALITFLLGGALLAQKPGLSLRADTNSILIGQQVNLQISAQIESNTQYQWPVLPDTITGLVIVEMGKIDTLPGDEGLQLRQTFTLTSFDSGTVNIPALTLTAGGKDVRSQPFTLNVNLPELSEEQDFYDIKSPLEVPPSLWYYLKWLLLPLLILLTGLAIWYFIKRAEKKKRPGAVKTPALPPYELALAQLHELEAEKLWQDGQVKLYYSKLVDILRLYLEREFAIKAMESTAAELAQKIKRFKLNEIDEIQRMLNTSAMVKYAREKPVAEENRRALELVRLFIEKTHVKPQEENAGV